jgi:Na+/H+-dicarboxylate symporter
MQITVLPTIVVSIISGMGGLKKTDARNVLLKGGSVLFMLWSLGIAAFFSMKLAFPYELISKLFKSLLTTSR